MPFLRTCRDLARRQLLDVPMQALHPAAKDAQHSWPAWKSGQLLPLRARCGNLFHLHPCLPPNAQATRHPQHLARSTMATQAAPASPPHPFAHLLPLAGGAGSSWQAKIRDWLAEDVPKFDIGGFVVGERVARASILMKSPGVMAGVPFVDEVFRAVGCKVTWKLAEGTAVGEEEAAAKLPVATVEGPVRSLLMGERTALNILSRASGVASLARRTRQLVNEELGWKGTVAATRKTTPGFGFIEKYAVVVGGCSTHRMDLSAMVMLKDNHVWSTGGIDACTRQAKQVAGHATKVEVECRDLKEALEAAAAGADIVMLDNFTPEDLKRDAKKFKAQYPHVLVEASGGIRMDTIGDFLSPDVDVVSQGSLTQGYACLDFSMKLPNPNTAAAAGGGAGGAGGAAAAAAAPVAQSE